MPRNRHFRNRAKDYDTPSSGSESTRFPWKFLLNQYNERMVKRDWPQASIVIPAYNEGDSIRGVLESLQAIAEHEIVVVDDGSSDDTAQVAESLGVRVVRHPTNKGYGAALKTGFRATSGEIVVTLDSDGQHDPSDIARLLSCMEEGQCDMVVGARQGEMSIPWLRRVGKWFLSIIASYLVGMRIPDLNSGFRAVRRNLVRRNLHLLPNGFSFSTTLTLALLQSDCNVEFVPILSKKRSGTSKVSLFCDGSTALLLILRAIMLFNPLKVFLPVGFGLLLLAVGYTLYTIASGRLNIPSGAIILFVSGVVVCMFGLIADQVAAMRRDEGTHELDN